MTRPTLPGRNGSGRLQLGGEQPLGGEQLAAPLEPGEQLAEADHPDVAGVEARGCRGWRSTTAWRARTTLAPSTSGGLSASKSVREQVTGIEMSATVSRRVRKTVFMPGRRLTWATWPSTHTAPSRSTQPAIALAICRTGAGCLEGGLAGPRWATLGDDTAYDGAP